MFPKTGPYEKDYNGEKTQLYFLIKDNDLLNKCNTVWNKFSADAKMELKSEPVYNKNYLKTQRTFYGYETTEFSNKEVPKVYSSILQLYLSSKYIT